MPAILENILCSEKNICVTFIKTCWRIQNSLYAYFQVLEENVKRKSANMATFHKSKLTSLMSTGNRSDEWCAYSGQRDATAWENGEQREQQSDGNTKALPVNHSHFLSLNETQYLITTFTAAYLLFALLKVSNGAATQWKVKFLVAQGEYFATNIHS